MMVITGNTENISYTFANVTGQIIDSGDGIIQYGHCYGTSPGVNINISPKTELGVADNIRGYTSELQDLQPGVMYYFKSYITSKGNFTKYGEEKFFTTLATGLATVVTNEITAITQKTASTGGTIINDGGAEIISRGVCWSTDVAPVIDGNDNKTTDGSGPGNFTSNITGLTGNTKYYVRAYATNITGTAYGDELSFTTEPIVLPTLVTAQITSITTNSAISGGNNIFDGGDDIIEKGICWSLTGTPTINDQKIISGGGPDDYVTDLTGLAPNYLYHVRAYAMNSAGTGYGDQVDFITDFICGTTLTDQRDHKTYLTKQYGTQCWMTANLDIGELIDGSGEQTNNDVIEKYCYDNNADNCTVYGGLYQWDEMMQYTTDDKTQGICPIGWHIPSDFEWKIFEVWLGMTEQDADGVFWRGSDEGGKLKAAGTTYWVDPNEGATNSTLFTALPSGNRTDVGTFEGINFLTDFWTSTLIIDTQCWYRYLDADHSQITRIDGNKRYATPVRCIRDR